MKANQGTPVQIFGQVYRLRSDEDAERVRQIAEMVDQKMNRIADRGASVDNYRIAVLAALELADELHTLRERAESRAAELEEKISELEESVNRLRSQNAAADKLHKAARSRVESLLERIESIG